MLESLLSLANDSTPVSQPRPSAIDVVPDSWGPKAYGRIGDIALTQREPDSIVTTPDAHFLLVFLTPQPKRELRLASDRYSVFDAPAGGLEVLPAGADFSARWRVPKENLLISLEPDRLASLAEREFSLGNLEMRPVRPGASDKASEQIANLIRDELLGAETVNRLYLDSLLLALVGRFVATHSSLADVSPRRACRGGLSSRIWREIESYMHENLARNITLDELAAISGLSYSHFVRAFRETCGQSPYRYLTGLRVLRASELVTSTRIPLKQIAGDTGFSSQSHMTTVMKANLRMTPGKLRRQSES